MNQLIPQRFQISKKEQILGFVSRSSLSLFEDSENITSTFRPEFSKLRGISYFKYADTIYGFSNLQNNWDSYNADVVSQHAIDKAIETLNYLNTKRLLTGNFNVNIFPMRDGGIQFEFDGEYICAELEIHPDGNSTFIHFDDNGNIIEKEQLFELSELSTLMENAQYA